MTLAEIAAIVGGLGTGLGAILALATVSVAASQVREQQRFQAAQLFMDHFADAAALFAALRENLALLQNKDSVQQVVGVRGIYSNAALLGHKISALVSLKSYAAKIIDDQDLRFLKYEMEDVQTDIENAVSARSGNGSGQTETVLMFADQVLRVSLKRVVGLLPNQ